jgi:DNA-binding CsgD family transcriptional regulator
LAAKIPLIQKLNILAHSAVIFHGIVALKYSATIVGECVIYAGREAIAAFARCRGHMRLQGNQAENLPLISSYFPRQKLLSALNDCKIGVVICDRHLRYEALSQSVAEIHNVPIKGHLGHSFHQILGSFAEKVAPFWENVLATGRPLFNLEVSGQLPRRSGVGRWIENLFPLADSRGRITQVGCFVIEIAPQPIPSSPPSSPTDEASSATGHHPSSPDRPQRRLLSRREQEVVRLVAEGKTNKEISSVLAISVRTVETYRSRLMLKLQATSVIHLFQYAVRNQIVTL